MKTSVRENVGVCKRGRSDIMIHTSTAVVPALPSESVPLPGPKETRQWKGKLKQDRDGRERQWEGNRSSETEEQQRVR